MWWKRRHVDSIRALEFDIKEMIDLDENMIKITIFLNR